MYKVKLINGNFQNFANPCKKLNERINGIIFYFSDIAQFIVCDNQNYVRVVCEIDVNKTKRMFLLPIIYLLPAASVVKTSVSWSPVFLASSMSKCCNRRAIVTVFGISNFIQIGQAA